MQLFNDKIELLENDGELTLYKGEFQSLNLLPTLEQLNFQQNTITMFGKKYNVPRQELWFGDRAYTYTGLRLEPHRYPKWLLNIQTLIQKKCNCKLNSVLINKYRDGNDYVSYHQDNEPELGEKPIIVSLSFGDSRKFRLKNITTSKVIEVILEDGDMLFMGPSIQENWKHELPKMKKSTSVRYNLTFRWINI
jgi:alkylated DNA repair dioxygenase AlkB